VQAISALPRSVKFGQDSSPMIRLPQGYGATRRGTTRLVGAASEDGGGPVSAQCSDVAS
jgi:hypothetical protein